MARCHGMKNRTVLTTFASSQLSWNPKDSTTLLWNVIRYGLK